MEKVTAIHTQNDFMNACAEAMRMSNPEHAEQMVDWIQEQTWDWLVDSETRESMTNMIETVGFVISEMEVI